jgi:hypothetical protein
MLKNNTAGQGVVFEFLGPPGAGKSYISDKVSVDSVDRDAVRLFFNSSRCHKVLRLLSFLAQTGGAPLGNFFLAFFRQADIDLIKFIKRVYRTLLIAAAQFKPRGMLLLDQGIGQSLWSLCIHSKMDIESIDKQLIAALYGYQLPAKIFFVSANSALISERLDSRKINNGNLSILHEFNYCDRQRLLKSSERMFDHLIKLYRELGVGVVELNGEELADSNSDFVEHIIRRF